MHPDVAETLQHLAELSEKQGKSEQARTFYQRSLAIREHVLGSEHPVTITTQDALAGLRHTSRDEKSILAQLEAGSAG
jgi:hypothetical protein